MESNGICPIWGTPARIEHVDRDGKNVFSPRAGGWHFVSGTEIAILENVDERTKQVLTTWLVDQRRLGNKLPELMSWTIGQAERMPALDVVGRAERALMLLAGKTERVGAPVEFSLAGDGRLDKMSVGLELLAWSASIEFSEVAFLLTYLVGCIVRL